MDSIIFDLDGTLWDSTNVILDAWNKVIGNRDGINKRITMEELQGIMGLQIKDIGNRLFPKLDANMQESILKECCQVECEYLAEKGGQLYPNLENVLKKLSARYKLYIVSNCQCGYIETFLKAHQLESYFLDYENAERTGLSKGENIKLIIHRNDLENPVYVGDTEGDFKAATFAQIPFVYAKYGFGKVRGYDYCIDQFEELGALFL